MPTIVEDNDRARILGALSRNDLILFLGAGFSKGARNASGAFIPTGPELARHLWRWLEYEGEPDNTSLALLYEAARKSPKGNAALAAFLIEHLHCAEIPSWYDALTTYYWRRIYTTNVDDIIELVYSRSRPGTARLAVVVAPNDDCGERDAFLNSIQYIKLNGTLSGNAEGVTFSTRQYARRLSDYDHW